MENNNYNDQFLAEVAEEQADVETPVVETPAEPVVEAVVEPVVEAVEETPAVEAVVEAPAAEEPVQSLGFTETGAIGSMAADGRKKKNVEPEADLAEKVAIHSTKSVRWESVGSISKGYNIVTKAQADKWLTRSHVRIATPEEVKKAFG